MNVLSLLCRQSLSNLERHNAGTHGPVSDQDIHGSMCSNDCLKSDSMREMAMNVSGCNCMELSTNPEHSLFKAPGDWCGASSGMCSFSLCYCNECLLQYCHDCYSQRIVGMVPQNTTGTFLCEDLHHCGEWTCALNDFHCRRMEYNATYVPLKGYGRDCSSALKLSHHAPFLALVLLLFLAISK